MRASRIIVCGTLLLLVADDACWRLGSGTYCCRHQSLVRYCILRLTCFSRCDKKMSEPTLDEGLSRVSRLIVDDTIARGWSSSDLKAQTIEFPNHFAENLREPALHDPANAAATSSNCTLSAPFPYRRDRDLVHVSALDNARLW